MPVPSPDAAWWNRARYRAGDAAGHYESWFLRANHPADPLAFWIRYTIFSPRGRAAAALGELWAIAFDGLRGEIRAAKSEVPLDVCRFSTSGLDVRIGSSLLTAGHLEGEARSPGARLGWAMRYAGGGEPLRLLPGAMYERPLPRAKAVTPCPGAVFDGALTVDGAEVPIRGWRGSQNHNWGSRHTDEYAWGQVAGFDGAPDAFLECSSARIRLGPVRTPWLTLVVLRLDGEEHRLNTTWQAVRARQQVRLFDWRFESRSGDLAVRGRMSAPASSFVALPYGNPPGGTKTCLNTKIAACELTVERRGHPPRTLVTGHRAAFEILTDRTDHGLSYAV